MAKYDRNIPFNDIPLLPPPTEIETDPEVLKKLVSASRALASVDSNLLRLPNPYMLVNTIALQEAKASTAIENIFTTEDELYKAISDTTGEEHTTNAATKEVLDELVDAKILSRKKDGNEVYYLNDDLIRILQG